MRQTKRASLSIVLFVIGIFIVCAVALVSFIVAKTQAREDFSGVALMDKLQADVERYGATGNLEGLGVIEEGGRYYFYQEHVSHGFLGLGEPQVDFSVRYPVS